MIEENLNNIKKELPSGVKLVAVSIFHPFPDILTAYQAGSAVSERTVHRSSPPRPYSSRRTSNGISSAISRPTN